MKKLLLIILSIGIKMLIIIVLGLLFSRGCFKEYVAVVSRTSELSFRFIAYIILVDILTLLLIINICKAIFKTSITLKSFLMYSLSIIIAFWLIDSLFVIEPRSTYKIHHLFTGIVTLMEYVIFYAVSTFLILDIYKISINDKLKLFLNYENFPFKNIINIQVFKKSAILYRNTNLIVFSFLIVYLNFIKLFLYSNNVFFLFNILIISVFLFYVSLILIHITNVIFNMYKVGKV